MYPVDSAPVPRAMSRVMESDKMPVDAMGVRHERAPDARIVSLVPSLTELMFALGLGPNIVGRTAYCVHPTPAVRKIPAVGGTKSANLESMLARKPTHAVVNIDENPKEIADALAAAGVAIVTTHPIAVEDNLGLYRLLGSIFGRESEAAKLADKFQERRRALRERVQALPERRVLYLIWKRPWMTVSADTYVSRLLAEVGWRTTRHDPAVRYPEVAIDEPLIREMDLILLSTEPFPFRESHAKAFVEEFPAAAGKVHMIDGEYTGWYGNRATAAFDYLGDFAVELAFGTRAPAA